GAIPIIGNLFKSRSGSRQKKNLVGFIRPRIMRDADATESTSGGQNNDERGQRRKLSFPFAKRHGILVRGIADGWADTVCRPGVTPQSLAEVRRFVGVPLKLERVSVESLDSMLRTAYEAGS